MFHPERARTFASTSYSVVGACIFYRRCAAYKENNEVHYMRKSKGFGARTHWCTASDSSKKN